MEKGILILDFGSQYTQLIARRIRELNVYCEIHPYNHLPNDLAEYRGYILSGSPCSVRDEGAPSLNLGQLPENKPVLGLCFGAQMMAKKGGGQVEAADHREFGRARLQILHSESPLLKGLTDQSQVWMSHSDSILQLPGEMETIARTADIPVAAFEHQQKPWFGIQFHPEVSHTEEGRLLLLNFIERCGCARDWTPAAYVEATVEELRQQLGSDRVVMALSGGVDSSVAATLISRAIGDNLFCIFVDNGLLRKNEFQNVLDSYEHLGLNVKGVEAADLFYERLSGISDPEEKRKVIGNTFIDVFAREAEALTNVNWLGQGTIYPDVIESVSVKGPSATIKSHHNVGGLPEKMHLKVVEPLKSLFKDEVRRVGKALNLPQTILGRHPFPGPGLGIRILGAVSPERVQILQEADHIYIEKMLEWGLYDQVWQAGAVLLPINSVGVMGDERTYENVLALRAVHSLDGMTADWVHFPYDFLSEVSNRIINRVRGINRVVYDISSKPPATIEWE